LSACRSQTGVEVVDEALETEPEPLLERCVAESAPEELVFRLLSVGREDGELLRVEGTEPPPRRARFK
jgi:hypothetical protein